MKRIDATEWFFRGLLFCSTIVLGGLMAFGAIVVLEGCAAQKPVPLPIGAINAVDAGINANLQAAHAAVVQYEADVTAGKHTPDATEKVIVNKLVASINVADLLYCGPVNGQCAPSSYHAQLVANPSVGEPQQLIDALAAVAANLTAIQSIVQGVK